MENENENGTASAGRQPHPFHPPSVEAVRAYCQSRQNRVDAEKFVDYYIANGWKVGKNSMKDWKAVVRNWARKDTEQAEHVSGYWETGKGVKGHDRREGVAEGSEKYDSTVL